MIFPKLLLSVGLLASSHHGWADYDAERAFTLEGPIGKVEYVNPQVLVRVRPAGDRPPEDLAQIHHPAVDRA